jgi:hypothetical protein
MTTRSIRVSSVGILLLACGNATQPSTEATDGEVATTEEALASACVSATEASGWLAQNIAITSPSFRVDFDAKTAGANDDALFGLSSGLADHYSDLAAIVRFNSAGMIDARDGGSYRAQSDIPYRAGQSRHFTLEVNVDTHRYSASEPIGEGNRPIASNYAFRTEQANVPALDAFALKVDSGGPFEVCNLIVTEPGTCAAADPGGGFEQHAFAPQSVAVTAAFSVFPDQAGIDGVVGLSAAAASGFNDLAAAVRFNPSGAIDVRNGNVYAADEVVPYSANQRYDVVLVVDVLGHAYSAFVNGTLLARNYAFRSQQAAVPALGNLAFIADSPAGGLSVCGIAISPPQGVISLHHAEPGVPGEEDVRDAAGNRYVAETFTGSIDLGGGPLVSAGGSDVYVAKYAASGAHLWSRRFGGTSDDYATTPVVNAAGEIATLVESEASELVRLDTNGSERFSTTVPRYSRFVLDPAGALALAERPATAGNFAVKLFEPDGSELWSYDMTVLDGGAAIEHIAFDGERNVIFAGSINGSIDAGVTIAARSSEGDMQSFLVKLSGDGALVYGLAWPLNLALGLAIDPSGNAVLGGYDYNPDAFRLSAFDPDGVLLRDVTGRHLVSPLVLGAGRAPAIDAEGRVVWSFAPRQGSYGLPLVVTFEPLP